MKTSKLTGVALDWEVAKCEGHVRPDGGFYAGHQGRPLIRYSSNWSQGGPIIERQFIDIKSVGIKNWLVCKTKLPVIVSDVTGRHH